MALIGNVDSCESFFNKITINDHVDDKQKKFAECSKDCIKVKKDEPRETFKKEDTELRQLLSGSIQQEQEQLSQRYLVSLTMDRTLKNRVVVSM